MALKDGHQKKMPGDWHTHNEMCHHAVGSIEDYLRQAIKSRLQTIGLSDHFPYEFLKNIERIPFEEYAITLPEIENYLSSAEKLKENYKTRINIRIGFEIDYFKNQAFALNNHLNEIKGRLDYILGSIHILNFRDGRGAWGFDDSRFRKDFEYYGTQKVYINYFKKLQKMLKSEDFDFDIVSHLDLPKKFNDTPNNKEIVFDEIMKALELIKARDKTIEVNTGGLRKPCKEQYPSEQILKEIYSLDIPILLGSDAHKPKDVGWKFKKILKILKKIGYNQLAQFNKRKRNFIEI
ncbi:MAG: histidinol-phosphatase HisJ [Promethearchaeota archaeon]|jgi:histidinol-phosphatase (PHP family)